MRISYLMLTGSLSGLLSVLAHSVLWSGLEMVRGRPSRAGSGALEAGEAIMHMLCGIGLGLLFWLSWGLAGIVGASWWARGSSFAGLCWLALAAPVLADMFFSRRITRLAATAAASRWATTCLITGLACSWSWSRIM